MACPANERQIYRIKTLLEVYVCWHCTASEGGRAAHVSTRLPPTVPADSLPHATPSLSSVGRETKIFDGRQIRLEKPKSSTDVGREHRGSALGGGGQRCHMQAGSPCYCSSSSSILVVVSFLRCNLTMLPISADFSFVDVIPS